VIALYKYFKRFCDFTVSLLALIILSPLFAIVAIAIKAESKGPVIFKQERLGMGGKVFLIYKFRSMCVGAEHTGTGQYSFAGDPRVTKVGKILRATSIDELPQLINVIKGEMSIVGFRPPLTYHPWPIEEYTPFQKRMFLVRPGITGWAQVNGRKDVEWHERIRLNVYYVDNISLLLDIKIVFLTFINVLKNKDNVSTKATVDYSIQEEEKVNG
jgi:undecaprenyl phosphate N,N'-diacetylbacillosamine 1-phosphate transferase